MTYTKFQGKQDKKRDNKVAAKRFLAIQVREISVQIRATNPEAENDFGFLSACVAM